VINQGEIFGEHVALTGEGGGARNVARYESGNLKGRRHLKDLGFDGRIILK
jgi:hypothetical protein